MNKKILIVVAGLACAVIAGAAYAMGPGGRGRMMKHMVSARIEDAEDLINATPQQRVVIEQSKENIFKAFESRMKDRRAEHAKVVDLLLADKLDTDALYALAHQHAQEIDDMAKVIIPEIQKVHDTLTSEQRQKLAAHAREMAGRHHGHGPGGFGGPDEE
jgi:Spy/CpxP family protein refolding chaperone